MGVRIAAVICFCTFWIILPNSGRAECVWCYAAFATSIEDRSSTVESGSSYGSTQDDADSTALEQCSDGGGRSCQVVYRFWHGACGALALGHNDSTGRVGWGTGSTRGEALQRCTSQGVFCKIADYRCTRR